MLVGSSLLLSVMARTICAVASEENKRHQLEWVPPPVPLEKERGMLVPDYNSFVRRAKGLQCIKERMISIFTPCITRATSKTSALKLTVRTREWRACIVV